MKKLNIDVFLGSLDDLEMAKYKILSVVKTYRKLFQNFKIYPYLAELIEIGYILAKMLEQKPDLPDDYTEELIQIDLYTSSKNYDSIYLTIEEFNDFFELIEWALPHLEDTVDEGKIIYDFVEENLDIVEGIRKVKANENGYFVIPDNQFEIINIYYFELSESAGEENQLYQLNTTHIDTISKHEADTTTFAELMKNYSFNTETSTFYFRTDLDFPFNETLLPIVKRKLTEKIVLV